MLIIMIMITTKLNIVLGLLPLYARFQYLAMNNSAKRSKLDQLIKRCQKMYQHHQRNQNQISEVQTQKIQQLLGELLYRIRIKGFVNKNIAFGFAFKQQNNIYFYEKFCCIFESKWLQKPQKRTISHKRQVIPQSILLIITNTLNGELLLILYIIIKHILMDNPRKDYQWANAHRFESNCSQLYPLDRMLTFYFTYEGQINLNCIDGAINFFKNNEHFQNQIAQFLIQMVEKVCSVTFNLLANNKCRDDQAKCYAAKNMLENIKYLCLEVSRIIKDSSYRNFKQQGNRTEDIEKITRDIASFICQQTKVYVQQIFPKYPSTPLSGYSQKLKNAIRSIDRRQDYTYDFLHIHKLQIGNAKDTQELISQIMIFLNKVKSAPYETIEGIMDENGQQQTYEECFQKFNRNLVWIISQKDITLKMIEGINPLIESKYKKLSKNKKIEQKKQNQNKSLEKTKQEKTQNNCLLQFLISPSQNNLLKIMKSFKGYQRFKGWELIQKYQQELNKFQREHKFVANSKISMNTQQFQKSEINNAELRFKNSALLRVVVKWVEDLQETLIESKKYIRDNGFKFKIKKQEKQGGKQLNLKEDLITLDQQKRTILQSAIKKAQSLNIKQNQNKINMFLVDSLMDQLQSFPHYNFQNSLKLSSQVNACIGKETVQNLIQLIGVFKKSSFYLDQAIQEHLKQKGKSQELIKNQKPKIFQQIKKVNLVSNRIGDLLRSKIVCTEPQFINLLTLLYELDKYSFKQINSNSYDKNKEKIPFFKIIRIKNKLKETTNNVHINYMFYGKIQCQLQICFLNNKKVQSANQTMHHFLYELKRGIYGVVPQLANVVNQNDPICQHNQSSNLNFIKYSSKVFKHKQLQERTISQSQKNKYVVRCIYKNCNQFSLQKSKKFIKKDEKQHRSQCLKCYVQKNKSKSNIFNALKKLQYSTKDEWLKEVLQRRTELQIQEIKENEQIAPGVYLAVYPTQKRVIVNFCIIIKHYEISKLIMKQLQINQNASECLMKKIYHEHKYIKKLYFKVNYYKLMMYFKVYNSNNKKECISPYLKSLSKKQIRLIKILAIKQFDKALLDKQIQNKQQHIRLNQMKSAINQFYSYIQKQQLMFVQRVYAQSISLQKCLTISKFPNLKDLNLKNNKLSGSLTIQNHPFLTSINLSYNIITLIQLINLKDLKNLNLDWNKDLQKFDFMGLTSLQILSMSNCGLKGQVIFRDYLSSLQLLNVGWNARITKLDLRNCPSLKNLNSMNITCSQLIFNQKVSLKSIGASNLKRLPQFSFDQLQKVDLQLSVDQINKFCFRYLRGDMYLSYQSIFDHIKSNKRQLQKLKSIKILLVQSSKYSTKLKYWQQNAIEQLLQQFIANLSNLSQLHLVYFQVTNFLKHLDLSRVQKQIQYIFINSDILKALKLNKVRKIVIDSKSVENLQILNPHSVKQFSVRNFNQSSQSQLAKGSFYKQCVNIQSISISTIKSFQQDEFTNLKDLRIINFYNSHLQNLIFNDNELQSSFKNAYNNRPQRLGLNNGTLSRGCIRLSQLKELYISYYQINDFNIKIPIRSIKKIQLAEVKIANLQISYYDENQKADLQSLRVDADSLALLKTQHFFKKVNSIKHFEVMKSKQQIRLSQICEKIEILTLYKNCKKLIINTSIKVINLKGMIAEFEFGNIESDSSSKRQELVISLSRQCLLKTIFMNNTKEVIHVAIKTKGFKSQQTLKEKNKEKNIRFTFISEQQQYMGSEQRDSSQKEQYLQKQLEQSRRRLDKMLEIIKSQECLTNEQKNIQNHQQNDYTKHLFKCPRYLLLSKSYNKQLKEQQQKYKSIQVQTEKQFEKYKQLLERCHKQLQEHQLNEFQEYPLQEKYNQCIKKWDQRHEIFKKQLLNRYCKQVQEDFVALPEDQRQELQKGLPSKYNHQSQCRTQ